MVTCIGRNGEIRRSILPGGQENWNVGLEAPEGLLVEAQVRGYGGVGLGGDDTPRVSTTESTPRSSGDNTLAPPEGGWVALPDAQEDGRNLHRTLAVVVGLGTSIHAAAIHLTHASHA